MGNEETKTDETKAPMESGAGGEQGGNETKTDDVKDSFVFDGIGGKFTDPKDLAEYAKGLEGRLALMQTLAPKKTEAQETLEKFYKSDEIISDKEKEAWAQKLLDDPVSVFNELGNRVSKTIKDHDEVKESRTKFWDEFYTENKELAAHKKVVDIIMQRDFKLIENMPLNEAKKYIAKNSSEFIGEIRGKIGTRQTLSDENTGGISSNHPGGTIEIEAPQQKTFAQEFKEFKMKKKGYA